MSHQPEQEPHEPSGPDSELLRDLYEELRARAGAYLGRERAEHTLSPTALVHEAYIRLADLPRGRWQGKTHFAAAAAVAMRRILVDHARARNSDKRGGGAAPLLLQTGIALGLRRAAAALDVLALDEAITKLGTLHKRQARVVEMRFFAEMTVPEVAQALGVSLATVEADWRMARTWLHRELSR